MRHLEGFPAFSDEGDSSTSMKLLQHEDDTSERPLAPVRSWPEPLRQYADLFPRRRILADHFAAEIDNPSVWSALEQRGFLRTSVLYNTAKRYRSTSFFRMYRCPKTTMARPSTR